MRWIKKLLGGSEKKSETEQSFEQFSDIFEGWHLSVTLNMSTPLKWLNRDGERCAGSRQPPENAPAMFGIWIPVTKSWRQLGYDIDELPPGTRASQFGPVPEDGGNALPFLKLYRAIVESGIPPEAKLPRLEALGAGHPDIEQKLNCTLLEYFVVESLCSLPGCGKKSAERLFSAGYLSPDQVKSATLAELMEIDGIGRTTALKLIG